MDRESLKLLLAQGLCVEKIAGRFGKHPSTVSYWMDKHGLVEPTREKHAAKGGIERGRLQELIEAGMTIAEIADQVGLSKTTVRHWLRRYELKTKNRVGPRISQAARDAKEAGQLYLVADCLWHGETTYVLEGRGYYRCKQCLTDQIARHRRRLKEMLVAEAGGGCRLCGYNRCVGALEFHHLDPMSKRLGISAGGLTLSAAAVRAEVDKCVLLCSNCHAEVESGVSVVPVE
jgi:transposase-like protein